MTLPEIIVIRGAPGAGKSETAKCLAARLGTGVRIEVDSLRAMVIDVDWTNQAQHVGAISLAADLSVGFLERGHRPVIVVDTFSGDKLAAFLEKLQALRPAAVASLFALAPSEVVLRARVERRPAHQFKNLVVSARDSTQIPRGISSRASVWWTIRS